MPQPCGQRGRTKWFLSLGLLPIVLLPISIAAFRSAEAQDPQGTSANCPPSGAGWTALDSTILPEPVRQTLTPVVANYLSAPPHPQIHGQARLAQVPILMYHDILPEKEVFFDVTPEEFEAHLQLIQEHGLTPISLDQLVTHLRTGMPLPEKPILLSFDDGYEGHYTYVYPLLKQYGYPGVFAIYTDKVGKNYGRSSLTWEQVRTMAADPLMTIASHSISHPNDLREFEDAQLRQEIFESKAILEAQLGIPIRHFVYPVGKYDARVKRLVQEAGYASALTMDDKVNKFAGESDDLFSIERIGQSQLPEVLDVAYGGPPLPPARLPFNFSQPVRKLDVSFTAADLTADPAADLAADDADLDGNLGTPTDLYLVFGGKPQTIHADSRYQVPEIIQGTGAIAAVDGGFFSLEYLDSNTMIGPVLSRNTGRFVPGNASENPLLNGRPLVLISEDAIKFVPFDAARHNTLEGVQAELPEVTDAFVSAAWLVKDGQGRPHSSFGNLFDFDVDRHRAFWGVDQAGRPVIGITRDRIDSVSLGQMLARAGLREAVMLDSGASTSLAYREEALVEYTPRPVPHVVALFPPEPPAPTPTADASTPVSCPVPIQVSLIGDWLRWAERIRR